MTQLVAVLSHSASAGLVLVGIAALVQWRRYRDQVSAWLALALGLLAATALVSELGAVLGSNRLLSEVAVLAFIGSGAALVGLRHALIPLGSKVRRIVASVLTLVTVVTCIAVAVPMSNTSPLLLAIAWLVILTWMACVSEPAIRFWVAARTRPLLQRRRLRLLSTGYLWIVAVLMVALLVSSLHSIAVSIAVEVVVLLALPQLYMSFSPPRWLRAAWRAGDERTLQRATDDLLVYAPDEATVARRALDWALRLAGADGGAVLAPDGSTLAQADLTSSDERQHVATMPIELGSGTASLVLRFGPLSALFRGDELVRIEQYAASVALALSRVQLERDLAQRTTLHETVLQAIADLGEGIMVRRNGVVAFENEPFRAIAAHAPGINLEPGSRREQEVRTPAGSTLHVETAVRQVEDAHGVTTVALVRDITERKAFQRATEEQARLLDLANDAIFVRAMQPNPTISYWSHGAEVAYGWTAAEAIGCEPRALLKSVYPLPLAEIERLLLESGHWEGELIHHRKDGTACIVASQWVLRRNPDGVPDGILEVNRDITQHRRVERVRAAQLGVTHALSGASTVRDMAPLALSALGSALELDVVELWLVDTAGKHLRMVDAWISPDCEAAPFRSAGARLGLRRGRGLAGRTWQSEQFEFVPDLAADSACDRSAVAALAGLHSACSIPIGVDGAVFGALNMYTRSLRTPDPIVVQSMLEIGRVIGGFVERRRTANALEESVERLEHLAATDALTGLSNRRAFEAMLDTYGNTAFGVIVIDVDNLKPINDEYGHEAGDVVLTMVGQTLRSLAREADMVARIGGDEFAVLLPRTRHSELRVIAERMRRAMYAISVPFGAARISLGWSTSGAGSNPREVLRAADEALYRAKSGGRDRIEGGPFAPGDHGGKSTPDVAVLLRDVLSEERIGVVFQPIFDLESREVFGYEALARPKGHGPSASVEHVFRAARRLGRIRDLDWLSRRAAVLAAIRLPGEPVLFINVSAVAFLDPVHPVDQLLLLLQSVGWPPDRVVLEITEQEAVRDLSQLRFVVASHREHGIRFAIDDVGEGHSTIELLAASNPEFIKIAGSLTSRLTDEGSTSAVRAALAFARSSRAQVIAEGIETEQTLRHLRALDVPLGQGYHLGRPMPVEVISATSNLRAS
jgi:diguanylate cyclase (GGDEF)-like protein/PAS domain S-box-containing protein